jgi:hypothetical protein
MEGEWKEIASWKVRRNLGPAHHYFRQYSCVEFELVKLNKTILWSAAVDISCTYYEKRKIANNLFNTVSNTLLALL